MKQITSLQNPYIKSLVLLKEKQRHRKQQRLFLIEGRKEISLALDGGYIIENLLFYSKICSSHEARECAKESEIIEINKEIFEKLAYRGTTEGVIGVARCKEHNINALNLSDNPLILIAESLEKPGNIGAILRTVDAARLDAVIITNPNTDLYNPNVVRSSVGCLFSNQIAIGSTPEVISFLKENNITIYSATLQNAVSYNTQDYTIPTALVVGSESHGLSQDWIELDSKNIMIPMRGKIDSMNVSVAAAVLIFEAIRQRGF